MALNSTVTFITSSVRRGMAIARGLGYNFGLGGWKVWVGTILVILGIGAIHELIEFASTIALGPKKECSEIGAAISSTRRKI